MKNRFSYIIWLLLAPLVVAAGVLLAGERGTAVAVFALVLLALAPLLITFEKKKHTAGEITVLAALVSFAAASRMALFALPGVKPVTAVVIFAGMLLGKEAGFAVGALSALVSGFAFGIGGFTPFQMLAWGLCGLLAGILAPFLKKLPALLLYGALSGAAFSLVMDVWTVFSADGVFTLPRFLGTLGASLPFTVLYAFTNVAFLWLLRKPANRILGRLQRRYGIFSPGEK